MRQHLGVSKTKAQASFHMVGDICANMEEIQIAPDSTDVVYKKIKMQLADFQSQVASLTASKKEAS